MIDQLAETDGRMKWASNKRLHVEIALIKSIQSLQEASLDDVIALIEDAAAQSPSPSSGQRAMDAPPPQISSNQQRTADPAMPTQAESSPSAGPDEAKTPTVKPASPSGAKGPEFWEKTKGRLIEERPLFGMWLEATHYIGQQGDEVIIGFAKDQRFYKDSLLRHETVINETLTKCLGSPAKIRMEVRDDLAPIGIDEEPDHVSPPPQEIPVPPSDAPHPEESGDQPTIEETNESSEDFYNDPLINEAVDVFDAKIKK